jgi:hypothetical protein
MEKIKFAYIILLIRGLHILTQYRLNIKLTEIGLRNCNQLSKVLKSKIMKLFKDGASEGE